MKWLLPCCNDDDDDDDDEETEKALNLPFTLCKSGLINTLSVNKVNREVEYMINE